MKPPLPNFVPDAGIHAIIENFPRIVLRGAGAIGQDMLDYLLSQGVEKKKIHFWDKNANDIRNISGIPVSAPFPGEFPAQETFIFHCILSLPYNADDYLKQGYAHHMNAQDLFCPYNVGTGKLMRICHPDPRCALVQCPRMMAQAFSYLPCKPNTGASAKTLLADKLTFSINTRCTLKCRHCIHYINHFSPESRIDFPCERILSDVDLACAAHDFIRIGVIQGGEPFLHPDFSRILLRLCSKSNVGMVQIFSNGICRISEENFSALQNERVHVRISSYMGTGVLNQKQEALLEKNLHRLQKAGVSHTLYRVAWNLAPTLRKREYSAEVLQRIKENCPCLPDSRLVVNGIYSPCHYAAYIALHDLGDYAEDKVSLSPELPRETLRRRIVEVNERSYYQSCAHCDFSNEQVLPAEQGVDARYAHIRQMKLHHDVET